MLVTLLSSRQGGVKSLSLAGRCVTLRLELFLSTSINLCPLQKYTFAGLEELADARHIVVLTLD
jgi:hypothetical protein